MSFQISVNIICFDIGRVVDCSTIYGPLGFCVSVAELLSKDLHKDLNNYNKLTNDLPSHLLVGNAHPTKD